MHQEVGVSTAVPSFSWRLDGLIGGRTWSGSAATFAYDAAKRVTSLAKGGLSLAQAYDRDGNVTSEGRSLTGVTGDPGTGTQSFTYDALGRVTGSSGLASGSRTYTYDRDGNRLTKVEGGSTYTSTYDRTDQLITVTKTGGSAQSFGYDAFGNMTIDAQSGLTITTMGYDLDDRLTGIDASGGTANDASFSLDALGRFRTRVIAAGTETYSYVESSETVARIAGPGGTTTDSIVSPAGDRLGVKVGTTVNWFLPDLHGSVAGSLDAAETTVVNAIRYDAWGQIIGTPGSAGGTRVGDKAWKYQGRLDVSPDGLSTPLYDMSARFYMPGTGTFSQLDTVMGSAQDPLSMNRFLYGEANPATLIDPTGHYVEEGDGGSYKAGPIVRINGKIVRGAINRRTIKTVRRNFFRAHFRDGHYGRPHRGTRRASPKDPVVKLFGERPSYRTGYSSAAAGESRVPSILAANGYAGGGRDDEDESQFTRMTWLLVTPTGLAPFEGIGPCAMKSPTTHCPTAMDAMIGGGGGGGRAAKSALSEWAKDAAEIGAAKALKPLVIGENMERITRYIDDFLGDNGLAYKPLRKPGERVPEDVALRRNGRMIQDAMRQGREIIDIGPDFARRRAGRDPSPYYGVERRATDGYDLYRRVWKRTGRESGGVPGIDF